ncbi:hypothetical protein M2298_004473 [Brevibacillus sp. 1238]|nr:hypothetical protein [Brevibacillus sp. 1238]
MQGTTFASVALLVGFVVVAIYVMCKAYSQKYKE